MSIILKEEISLTPNRDLFLNLLKLFSCLNLTKLWPFHNLNHVFIIVIMVMSSWLPPP